MRVQPSYSVGIMPGWGLSSMKIMHVNSTWCHHDTATWGTACTILQMEKNSLLSSSVPILLTYNHGTGHAPQYKSEGFYCSELGGCSIWPFFKVKTATTCHQPNQNLYVSWIFSEISIMDTILCSIPSYDCTLFFCSLL